MAEPKFAIIIPIYRQPGLAAEAIACALREAESDNGVVVLVNDGCPYAETQALCLDFAAAYPARVDALHTANRGLSAARNCGIRHAMARFPGLGAVFLLDADNRLKPGAMRRALAALATSGADWVYPDIDKFGQPWHGDMSGPYSQLRHLAENICDAGSLIHARVFAAGLAFDESLQDGYEDWDFWLRCADAGLRGAHCPNLGFQYRARPESMVREADRMRPQILSELHRRHPHLYAPHHILRLEHREAPRFCVVDLGQQRFDFTSAAGASSRGGGLDELEALFWQAACHPVGTHFPPFVVLLDRAMLMELLRLRLADWLFWQLETQLESSDAVEVHVVPGGQRIAIAAGPPPGDPPAQIAALGLQALRRVVADPAATPRTAALRLDAPAAKAIGRTDLPALAALLRATAWRQDVDAAGRWRAHALIPGEALYRDVRRLLQARGPLARGSTGRELGLIASASGLPAAAQPLARAGWTTRLVVVGSGVETAAPDCEAMALFGETPDPEGLLGLLAGCTAVIDCGTAFGLEVMGTLRRQGVVTACTVTDRATQAQALAYEHALEIVIVPNAETLALCRASGIPAAKLLLAQDWPAVRP